MSFEDDFPSLKGLALHQEDLEIQYDGSDILLYAQAAVISRCLDKSIVEEQYLSKQRVREVLEESASPYHAKWIAKRLGL